MYKIDAHRCNGCGVCTDVCPPGAIALEDDTAVIDQGLCTQCGNCATACPANAVYNLEPAPSASGGSTATTEKGGDTMPYGYGYRAGFGFRGSSAPWPYVGRGRGGLPRCYYPGAGIAPYTAPVAAYRQAPAPEDEMGYLKNQADMFKNQLEDIEARMCDLDSEK